MGADISRNAPPMPERVVSSDGKVLYTRADIEKGRQVWQSIGGMQLGSIWGHGGYVAPDWSADWLHREATAVLDGWARAEFNAESYAALVEERRPHCAGGSSRACVRTHTTRRRDTVTLDTERAAAIASRARSLRAALWPRCEHRRSCVIAYAMKNDTVPDAEQSSAHSRGSSGGPSWAAMTERPGSQDHLHEQLAERAADRQSPAGLALICGRRSACCS